MFQCKIRQFLNDALNSSPVKLSQGIPFAFTYTKRKSKPVFVGDSVTPAHDSVILVIRFQALVLDPEQPASLPEEI